MAQAVAEQSVDTDAASQIAVPDILVLEEGLPCDEVARRIGVAYAAAGLRHRVLAFYLDNVEQRGLHQLDGCRTVPQWAAHRFGMSRREAQMLLRAGRALRELPVIDQAFAEGRLGWSKVRELVKVAVPEHEQAWLDLARRAHIDELSLEVKLSRTGDPPRNRDSRKGLPEVRLRLNMPMPPDVYAKWEQARKKVRHGSDRELQEWECLEALCDLVLSMRDDKADGRTTCAESPYTVIVNTEADGDGTTVETEDGPVPLDPLTAELIDCDSGGAAGGERRIPPAMRRKVLKRDKHRCRRCSSRFRLHEHHIIEWFLGGPTEPWNLLTLCRGCHSLVHAGLLIITGEADSCRFESRDGTNLAGPEPEPAAYLPAPVRLSLPDRTGDEPRTVCAPRPSAESQARPGGLGEVVGQEAVVRTLATAVEASRLSGEPVGHILLAGPPGLGKTSIARGVASDSGVALHETSGTAIRTVAVFETLVEGVGDGGVLFVDEIHALPPGVAEGIYKAMEDRRFTLIGATTDAGLLPPAFLDRFVYRRCLEFYEPAELAAIIERAAPHFGVGIDPRAARELAGVSRGTPRRALMLLRGLRDEAVAAGRSMIDLAHAARSLDALGIDGRGLCPLDRRYLAILRKARAPIGLDRLALLLGTDAGTLKRDHEPYLAHLGLVAITPRGRLFVDH